MPAALDCVKRWGLWPEIVPVNREMEEGSGPVFTRTRWFNIHDPSDAVAVPLVSFDRQGQESLDGPVNLAYCAGLLPLVSHIRYVAWALAVLLVGGVVGGLTAEAVDMLARSAAEPGASAILREIEALLPPVEHRAAFAWSVWPVLSVAWTLAAGLASMMRRSRYRRPPSTAPKARAAPSEYGSN